MLSFGITITKPKYVSFNSFRFLQKADYIRGEPTSKIFLFIIISSYDEFLIPNIDQ